MKFKKIMVSVLTIVILLELAVLPVFAASGDVYIFTYTWDGYNTRAAGSYDVFKHIWAMGYSGTEYLNNGAPPAFSVLPNASIWVVATDGGAGIIHLGSKGNTSYMYGGSSCSGNDRAIGKLPANALSKTKAVIYAAPYSAKSNALGNLCKETYKKGAKFVIGWNGRLDAEWSPVWLEEFFRTSNVDKETTFKSLFNGEKAVLLEFGGTAYDCIGDIEVYGDLDLYLHK